MDKKSVYKVVFVNQGAIYELYARSVIQSEMLGFIELEQLLFGEQSAVVVDPSEEKLKNEFNAVKRTFVPMHAVIRIDEVDKQGISKIKETGKHKDNVAAFPGSSNSNFFNPPPNSTEPK